MTAIPQSKVFEEFDTVPEAVTAPFRAHLVGPQAYLARHGVASEKARGRLGAYDPVTTTEYSWPNRPAGAKVDLDYTKVYIDDALLLYFQDLVSSGSTVTPVASYKNRVRSSSVAFKTSGVYTRSSSLYDRDVKVNDVAYVRGTVGGTEYELTSYVKDFVGEPISATVDVATAVSTNQAASGAGVSIDKVGGPDNCVTPTADVYTYDGLEDGDVDETYTVEVTTGSIDSDWSTAVLRVTSASGNDDVAAVSPEGSGDVDVGTRGLRISFQLSAGASCSSAADGDEVSHVDLVAGQKWRVHVTQAYSLPTATSSGTYTGDVDTTYIVEVTKGGAYGDEPEITCTTTTGVDTSGPTKVSAADSAVAVGSEGVFISFSGAGLCKGDKWTVEVTAAAEGSLQTLVLGHDLPDALASATDLDLKLYIKKTIEVTENRLSDPPNANWEADADSITLNSAVTAYDSSWTNNGVQLALPVKGGTAYVEYRAWVTDYVRKVGELSDADGVADVLGAAHPDNPLAYGVWLALVNGDDEPVRFTAVADPDDVALWTAAFRYLEFRGGSYNLVPLTFDEDVQDACVAHVKAQAGLDAGTYRACFLGLQGTASKAIANSSHTSDGAVILATVGDDPDVTGTAYTLVEVTSDNINLLTDTDLAAGDFVRLAHTADAFGAETYSSYEIEEVVHERAVRLVSGPSTALPTPAKVEFWRSYDGPGVRDNAKARALELATAAGADFEERVCAVWPDQFTTSDGDTADGYFLGAALAGLRGGCPPHRALRDVELTGVAATPRTNDFLTVGEVRELGEGRVWVVGADEDDAVVSLYAVTCGDPTDVNKREESARSCADAVRLYVHAAMGDFFTTNNVHPESLERARTQLRAALETLKTAGQNPELGAVLTDATIDTVQYSVLSRDRLIVKLDPVTLPVPHSKDLDLTLVLT
jgi:hypothetical protein